MSILIKGIKLPNKNEILTLYIDGDGIVRNYDHLTKIGEAVEVPTPHGRLIDEDEITSELNRLLGKYGFRKEHYDAFKSILYEVEYMSTIIEAEE